MGNSTRDFTYVTEIDEEGSSILVSLPTIEAFNRRPSSVGLYRLSLSFTICIGVW
jgi:hypothetical protein